MSRIYDFLGTVSKLGLDKISQRNLPKTNGQQKIKGIRKKIEIIRDKWGIPHIYAKNLHDLSFAQGYVHAQDRLWQMEASRRVATGTLSEILGEDVLDIDIAARTFGFNRLGKTDIATLGPHLESLLEAYLAGINTIIRKSIDKPPVEFTLLKIQPREFTMQDLMAFSRLMTWQLSHAWQGQLLRAKLIEKVGPLRANELEKHYPQNNPSILPEGITVNAKTNAIYRASQLGPLMQGNGSNSWAISPEKSTTGKVFLCNDPHLNMSAPAIWYENHLHCPGFHSTGVTIPSFPLVLIGHNEHISWGITLAFTDCEDIFVEEFKDENCYEYRFKDEWKETNIVREVINIKGQEMPHVEQVIHTHHGPVVSEIANYPNKRITLNSMSLKPALPSIKSWWKMNNAENYTDFVHAMSFMKAPQLNVVYGDVHGNIAYWLTGDTPIRAKGDGRLLADGASGEYEWIGKVPFMEMPHALNPAEGFVMTANNKAVNDDYPYNMGFSWMNGFRARRIQDLFEARTKISPLDSQQIQIDTVSIPGQQFIEHFKGLKIKKDDPILYKAHYLLTNWDGNLHAQSAGGCIYKITSYFMVQTLFEPALGLDLTYELIGNGFHPVLNSTNEFQGYDIVTILRLLEQDDSWWINNAGGKEKVLMQSLKKAVNWLSGNLGTEPINWQWGQIHYAIFNHGMGAKKPLDKVFNVGPFPLGGDGDTPWQANETAANFPNLTLISASYRQIIDMGDLSQSKAILPPGQSGHIGSPHYQDQVEDWLAGKLRPMLWTKEQVAIYAEASLSLKPKK